MATFRKKEFEHFTLVEFELDEPLSPEQLEDLLRKAPEVKGSKGVIISGRGPIWLHSALAHHYHPTKWVAHYDPRLDGGVVAQTHTADVRVGQVIRVE